MESLYESNDLNTRSGLFTANLCRIIHLHIRKDIWIFPQVFYCIGIIHPKVMNYISSETRNGIATWSRNGITPRKGRIVSKDSTQISFSGFFFLFSLMRTVTPEYIKNEILAGIQNRILLETPCIHSEAYENSAIHRKTFWTEFDLEQYRSRDSEWNSSRNQDGFTSGIWIWNATPQRFGTEILRRFVLKMRKGVSNGSPSKGLRTEPFPGI